MHCLLVRSLYNHLARRPEQGVTGKDPGVLKEGDPDSGDDRSGSVVRSRRVSIPTVADRDGRVCAVGRCSCPLQRSATTLVGESSFTCPEDGQGVALSVPEYLVLPEMRLRIDIDKAGQEWKSDDVIDAVLDNYDRLSDETKSELPLKRIWTLVPNPAAD